MIAFGVKIVDANVWLAIAFRDHVHHQKANDWFSAQQRRSCAFCRITQLALLRHLTNQKIMGRFLQTQVEAWAAYDELIADERVVFIADLPAIDMEFRRLTSAPTSFHYRWTDAYLAALANVTAASLVTFDQGFRSFLDLNLELIT